MSGSLGVYFVWMAASVIWQNFITFGILYQKLMTTFSENVTMVLVMLIFLIGHMILLPDKFGLEHFGGLLFILITTIILIVIRRFTHNLNLETALHLAFHYFLS